MLVASIARTFLHIWHLASLCDHTLFLSPLASHPLQRFILSRLAWLCGMLQVSPWHSCSDVPVRGAILTLVCL